VGNFYSFRGFIGSHETFPMIFFLIIMVIKFSSSNGGHWAKLYRKFASQILLSDPTGQLSGTNCYYILIPLDLFLFI